MVTDVKFTPDAVFEFLALKKIKQHLRLDCDCKDEDDLLADYLAAAVESCENYLGGHIVSKKMEIKLDAFESPLVFEAFPLQSVLEVLYFPKEATEFKLMPTDLYSLSSVNDKVFSLRFKQDLPVLARRFDAVVVTVKLGFEAGKVPKPIQQAVLLRLGDMYEKREDRSETIALASMALLRPYKKF